MNVSYKQCTLNAICKLDINYHYLNYRQSTDMLMIQENVEFTTVEKYTSQILVHHTNINMVWKINHVTETFLFKIFEPIVVKYH